MSNYHALLDTGTCILLALHTNMQVINFLSEALSSSTPVYLVNRPNYTEFFPLSSLPRSEYVDWSWTGHVSRTFVESPVVKRTDETRDRSSLALAIADTVERVMISIGYARSVVGTGTLFQETVYIKKMLEARRIREHGASEAPHEYPFVIQYADYAGISIEEAADEIIFKSKLDDQVLAQTELLRIRYFNKLKRATSPVEVSLIEKEFYREAFHRPVDSV